MVGYSTKTFTMMIISIERSYSGRKYFVKSVSSNRFFLFFLSSSPSFFLSFYFRTVGCSCTVSRATWRKVS